jgi:hypothetical protein
MFRWQNWLRWLLPICMTTCLIKTLPAQDGIRVPSFVVAGDAATVSTSGSGKATFYLIGPGVSRKNDITLGSEIQLATEDLRNAGAYLAIVCSDSCRSAAFYVIAGKPASLTFLVHPSRVPVAQENAVSGVALPFDQFHNLVLAPMAVNFQLATGNVSLQTRAVTTKDGAAWFRTTSGKSAGSVQVVATAGELSTRRIVQQVASDPCNLRIKGERTANGILVQTEPVHDCSGNAVPDGTIVTFTATEATGKSTVDAPIKKGIARAEMSTLGDTVISVASGVAMGNDLRIGARP